MKKEIIIIIVAFFGMTFSAFTQKERKMVRQGNTSYESGNYEAAAESYRKGLEENVYSYEANFNLGDALYQQGEYESAAKQFDLLRQPGMNKGKLANVYHNLGNTMMEQQKYKEAVEAYKEALRNDPSDADTRYNLVYAMEKLKEQQENQQNQDQDQENQDNQEQQDQENQEQNEEQEDQQNQEEQEQNQEQQNQDQQEQEQQEQNQQQEQQKQQGEQQKNEISRQEAERILQALQMDEKKLHDAKKKKKLKGQRVKILKDW